MILSDTYRPPVAPKKPHERTVRRGLMLDSITMDQMRRCANLMRLTGGKSSYNRVLSAACVRLERALRAECKARGIPVDANADRVAPKSMPDLDAKRRASKPMIVE